MITLALDKVGYASLFGIVLGQGVGLPLPGGISLIVAGSLAAQGKLNIVAIYILGITASIIGSNIGYLIGRRYGTDFLKAPGPLAKKRHLFYKKGHPIVERYGWLAVLFAKFFPVLREGAPIITGSLAMKWKTFAIFNAIACIEWVLEHASIGYFFGRDAEHLPGLLTVVIAKYILVVLMIAGIGLQIRRDQEVS